MTYGDSSSYELFFLYELAKVLASSIDLSEVLEYVLDGTCALLGAEQGFVSFLDGDGMLRSRASRGLTHDDLRSLSDQLRPALSERQPRATDHPSSAEGTALGTPLVTRNEVRGLLGVSTAYSREFTDKERERLTAVANLSSLALENARLYERVQHELALGRRIQQSFLPTDFPAVARTDLAAISRPALEVGGDFYDLFSLPGERLGLVVADVSEKGVPAALFMALTRSLMRVYAEAEPSPNGVLDRVNDFLVDNSGSSNMFVTLFYAIWDPARASLTYANAGHNPPLLRRQDRSLESLPPGGLALGVFPDQEWTEKTISLQPGDLLFAYSDGLTEAMNSERECFGEGRLKSLLEQPLPPSSQEILNRVLEETERFVAGYHQMDDLTALVLHVAGPGQTEG